MKKTHLVAIGATIILLLVTVTAVFAFPYVIQSGDTLYGLARRFNTTVQTIAQANPQITNINVIRAGDTIEIPNGQTPPPTPNPTPTPQPPPTGSTTYTVRAGDTLFAIALRFGTTVQAIVTANNLSNPNFIYIGQVLTIPAGGTQPPPPTPNPPPTNTTFELGGQSTGFGARDRMNFAGMSWIKVQHKWQPGDSADSLAGIIQEAHNNNFKILISVTGATAYPAQNSIDFAAYAQFMGNLARLGPDALEVWNEMNIDFEWPAGQISPSDYVSKMLAPTYNAIKAANNNVMVISGALAPTGFDNGTNAWADDRYVRGMAAAGAASYLDCIGVHHNAGATSPAVTIGHPAGTHYSWYFFPTLNVYYNAFSGTRKVCFTELGYLSGDGFPGLPGAFSWASGTSVAEHAQWLAEAVNLSRTNTKVRLLIVYNVDFTNYDVNGDPQAGYAMVRPDGSCPSCDTLHAITGGR